MTRVSDLAGAELALWVARALGWKLFYVKPGGIIWYILFEQDGGGEGPIGTVESGAAPFDDFQPSTNWVQGGPLIEKHHIETAPTYDDDGVCVTGWVAMMFNNIANPHPPIIQEGPTPLIAAMRALVASVYGDSVPDGVEA